MPKKCKDNNLDEHFAKRTNDDLMNLPSQLWIKSPEDVSYVDQATFAGLKTISGIVCDLITKVLNETHIKDHHFFLDNLDKMRRDGKGMLTTSNHSTYPDDPFIPAALLNGQYLNSWKILFGDDAEYENWKWTPAEKRNFFYHKNERLRRIFRWFFGRTKTVPILRGQGLNQIAQTQLESFLRQGDWVHVFGEGTRTRKHGELGEFKPGIGKLIYQAPETLIVPFGHDGLQNVTPLGSAAEVIDDKTGEVDERILRTGQRIQIVIGEPFTLTSIVEKMDPSVENYLQIAEMIRTRVAKCHQEAIELNK